MRGKRRESEDQVARIDCRGRTVAEVVGPIIPWCRQARSVGATPVISLHHLELLGDSLCSLLKALDRLAIDFAVRVTVADRSGLTRAFLQACREGAPGGLSDSRRVMERELKPSGRRSGGWNRSG